MLRRHAISIGRSLPLLLLVAALASVLSLGSVLSAYAMPVEARTTEAWYAYESSVGYRFVGHMQTGTFYPNKVVQAEELASIRLPVDPPVHRRVLMTRFTESVAITIPYAYRSDRAVQGTAKLKIDGMLVVPGLWQKPYPILQEKELQLNGLVLTGAEEFQVPLAPFVNEIEHARKELNLALEPIELLIRPWLEVQVNGLKQPVRVENSQEFKVTIRSNTVELDEPREGHKSESLTETIVTPVTIRIFGQDLRVGMLRQVATYSLVTFLLLAAGLLVVRRLRTTDAELLQRLGSNLLVVRSFEPPPDAALAEVRSARELLQLHVQTERPVIRAGSTYYLLDGSTCYRLRNVGPELNA